MWGPEAATSEASEVDVAGGRYDDGYQLAATTLGTLRRAPSKSSEVVLRWDAVSEPRIRSFGKTDIGRKRQHNEDAFFCDDGLGLWVVADGVGGQAKGEVASEEAVDQVYSFVKQGQPVIDAARDKPSPETLKALRRLLESAIQSACYVVFGMAEVDPSQKGMSTTVSALFIPPAGPGAGRYGVTAQVGDSRIYRVRGGRGNQLTEDHTLINHKLKQGLISEADAKTMKGKNVITRAVGHKDYVEVDTQELEVRPGDRFLVCSDGLHGYLEPGEVEGVLLMDPVEDAAGRFIQLANDRGGRDNITAVVVVVESAQKPARSF